MIKPLVYFLFTIGVLSCSCSGGQKEQAVVPLKDSLAIACKQKLEGIVGAYKATIGIAVMGLEDRDTILVNNDHHYPMQSVYKFPLAMAVLHQVDAGKFSLNQEIRVSRSDLHPKTWSPLRYLYPKGNIKVSIRDLLNYTVSQSDNNTCDILFGLLSGPKEVEKYIHDLNIKNIAIAATEYEMSKEWNVQYSNWAEPMALVNLLDVLYHKKHLSDSSSAFLLKLMTESSNSVRRIKGLLPAETVVAHKTGTGRTNERGITSATNDTGIITLPNGKHVALAVFVSDSMEKPDTNEKIIAEIAKTVYAYYTMKK